MATNNTFQRFIQTEWEEKSCLSIDEFDTTDSLQSLTQAIQQTKLNIPDLDVHFNNAEKLFFKKNKYKLSNDEHKAIHLYTTELGDKSLYILANRALCSEDRKLTKSWLPFLRLFYSAIKKLPDDTGVYYRGATRELLNKIVVNSCITWSSITSCSSDGQFIEKNCLDKHKVLLKINAYHVKDIFEYSASSIAKEVLMMPGTRLEVKSISSAKKDNTITVVHLQEVSSEIKPAIATTLSTELQQESQESEPIFGIERFKIFDHENKPSKFAYGDLVDAPKDLKLETVTLALKIDHLGTFIQQAQNHHDRKSEAMAAVTLYVMEWGEKPICKLLNEALKSGIQKDIDSWLSYLKLFRFGLEKLNLFSNVCWLGTNINLETKFKQGETIISQGFTSCSKSRDFILKYCIGDSGTLIKIDAINGRDLAACAVDPITQEVILTPGTILRVKKVGPYKDKGSIILFELQEINKDNQDKEADRVLASSTSDNTTDSSKPKQDSRKTTAPKGSTTNKDGVKSSSTPKHSY